MHASRLDALWVDRDLSWLQFNARVLEEALDESYPFVERMRFLGIHSNNLDEFYRVRYAQLLHQGSAELIQAIDEEVAVQSAMVDKGLTELMESMNQVQVSNLQPDDLSKAQRVFIVNHYVTAVSPFIDVIDLSADAMMPDLKDSWFYLAVTMAFNDDTRDKAYALIAVPSSLIGRVVLLPAKQGKIYMFLDDVIRVNISHILKSFQADSYQSHAFKISRDANLESDRDLYGKTSLEQLRENLEDRKMGKPVRMVHDKRMPVALRNRIVESLGLNKESCVFSGGTYHSKRDLMHFPDLEMPSMVHAPQEPLPHPDLQQPGSITKVIRAKDVLLMTPYQSFHHVVDWLKESATDPAVKSISMTLYRVAKRSGVIQALVLAARNGKQVKVVIELQARFNESHNLTVVSVLRKAGVDVIMGQSGRKVHAKLMLIERKPWRSKEVERFALIGTGNFHEANAKVYTDYLLLTSHAGITQDVHDCFKHMEDGEPLHLKHLIHSPHKSEAFLLNKLKQMQAHVANGGRAEVMFKCNALIHEGVINQLVESGRAGVKIRLIVRGMCALRPQIKGLTENIEIISIVGRYLEHARVYAFAMDDRWSVHIASFDLMTRNLHQRMEVACPVLDEKLANEILEHLAWQWDDGVKARVQGTIPANRLHDGKSGNSQDMLRQSLLDSLTHALG